MERIEPVSDSPKRKVVRIHWAAVLPYGAFLLLAAGGLWLLAFDMAKGPWAFSDSVEYIVSAKSLLAGKGLGIPGPDGVFLPLTLHPPLYSLMIAVLLAFGMDMWAATGGLNLLFYGLSILLAGAGTYRLSRSFGWGLASAALMIAAAPVVRAFDGAMSEAPFIFLTLLSLYLLAFGLQDRQFGLLVASAIAAAAAALTRYIGFVSGALGVLALIAFSGLALRKRLGWAAMYGAFAVLPPVVWMLFGAARNGAVASRTLQFGGPLLRLFMDFRKAVMEVFVQWLPYQGDLPNWRWKVVILLGVVLISVGLFALAWWISRRKLSEEQNLSGGLTLWALGAIYLAGYLGFLLVSYLFSSLRPDLNERTLVPLLPLLGMLVFGALFLAIRALRMPFLALAVPVALFILIWSGWWPETWEYVQGRSEIGSGYSMEQWRSSALIEAVRKLPEDVPLVSNEAAVVLLYTGRFPYEMSEFANPLPPGQFTRFGEGSGPDEVIFREQCGALVLFEYDAQAQFQQIYGDNSDERLAALTHGLQPAVITPQGGLYFAPSCPVP